jgi:hypothetical protein
MKLFRRYTPDMLIPWWDGLVRIDYLRNEGIHTFIFFSTVCRVTYLTWQWLGHPFRNAEPELVRWARTKEKEFIKKRLRRSGVILHDDYTFTICSDDYTFTICSDDEL